MFNRKPAANPKERSSRIVSGRRAAGATTPTSVSLTLEEKSALMALAKKRNVSLSHLLRTMAQKALAEDGGEAIPTTVGIVDGIYPATIHDDVVTLSNMVVALGFVVETLDRHASRNRRLEARAQLKDVLEQPAAEHRWPAAMMIKVMSYTAMEPQRPGDLARLLRYMLDAKVGAPEVDAALRLAGPPFVRRLVQRTLPWGADSRLAADDLAHQMFQHIRAGCEGEALPRQVYSHVVLSFSPRLSRKTVLDPKVRPGLGRHSAFAKSLRIVLDALENLGVGEHFPLIAVMHGDRSHLHGHVVVAHHVAGSPPCRIHARNSSTLRFIARNLAQAHGLPIASSTLATKHKNIVRATRDRN